jgi:amino acid transporter
MNFAFGFTEVAVLSSIAITYGVGLTNGGPSVIIWGFVVQFVLVMFIAFSMAEICSAYPSAGSVYHWAGQLASPETAPIWSYVCGWLNFLG